MTIKPFKTYNQQLKILRERGLIIKNGSNSKRILERENYYSVINGYKELFLLDKPSNEDIFRSGTTFEDIYQLFSFDRDLKNLFLPEIIKFESFMKSQLAYHFHKSYPERNSFLAFENYSNDPAKASAVLSTIAILSNKISNQRKNAVTYYIQKYQHCPLWVLVNFLTFGNISKFYKVCSNEVRLNIAKEFSKHYRLENGIKIQISPEMLDEALGCMVMYRNICAHDERLYNYKGRFKERALSRVLNTTQLRNKNLFSVLILLKLFLKKKTYKNLVREYRNIFTQYQNRFTTVSIEDIKSITGYDDEWISTHL